MGETRKDSSFSKKARTRKEGSRGREFAPPLSERIEIKVPVEVSNAQSFHDLREKTAEAIKSMEFQINKALATITKYIDSEGKLLPGAFALYLYTQAYSIENLTEDREMDADTAGAAEISDVLGTLIQDLQEWGIVP